MTVKVRPAIVIVPTRRSPGLADTRHATVPLPLPLAPAVSVTHVAAVVEVQEQPVPAVTLTLPVDAVAGTDADVADSA